MLRIQMREVYPGSMNKERNGTSRDTPKRLPTSAGDPGGSSPASRVCGSRGISQRDNVRPRPNHV